MSTITRSMLRGIQDAIWLSAWADAVEEAGDRLPRNITRETADPIPLSARKLAARYARVLARENGGSLVRIAQRAAEAEGRRIDPEKLGYDLTMQGLGHGVSWTDDHASFYVRIPRVEAMATRTGRHWHLDGEVSTRSTTSLRDVRRRRRR